MGGGRKGRAVYRSRARLSRARALVKMGEMRIERRSHAGRHDESAQASESRRPVSACMVGSLALLAASSCGTPREPAPAAAPLAAANPSELSTQVRAWCAAHETDVL